jgi:hypothetical protein
MQSIKRVLDGVYRAQLVRKQAEREKVRAAIQVERAAKAQAEAAEVSRQAQLMAYKARIPVTAYEVALADLGLSTRVLNHLEKSDLVNIGQIHERLANGDELMLSIEGIGPKGLSEIKQAIEDKGLGLLPIPEPVIEPEVVEQPIEPAAPIGAEAAAAAIAEGAAIVKPIVGAPAVEEEDEDDPDKKLKKKAKRKDRTLVLDEESGQVVAKKQRKSGRAKDLFALDDEDL